VDDGVSRGWRDLLTDDTAASLDDDTVESVAAETATDDTGSAAEENATPDHRGEDESVCEARRRWAKNAVAAAPHLTLVSRMLILRFVIGFYCAGNWHNDDTTPLAHIRDLIATLDESDVDDRLRARAASLAAVALTVIRQRALSGDSGDVQLIYDAALRTVRTEATSIDQDAVAEYCRYATNAYGFPLEAEDVVGTIDALATNPLADLTSSIRRRGWTVERHSDTSLTVRADLAGAVTAAIEVVGEAEQHTLFSVLVLGRGSNWCLAARNDSDMIIAWRGRTAVMWKHYRLEAPFGAGAFALQYKTDPEAVRRKLKNRPPWNVKPAIATEVLSSTKAPPLPEH
jgi:hypothetical protein